MRLVNPTSFMTGLIVVNQHMYNGTACENTSTNDSVYELAVFSICWRRNLIC